MPDNSLTLTLNGDVPLTEFSETMQHFAALVDALSKEAAGDIGIEWTIEELHAGSATTTVMGRSTQDEAVRRVVRAYEEVGTSLERGLPIPYSERVAREARAITSVLNDRITSITFHTARTRATITQPPGKVAKPVTPEYSLGTITGTIETLSSRGGLKFYLYDALFDQPVRCYLTAGQEETMRKAWGKRVVVAGRIRRGAYSGRPVVMRDISHIGIAEEVEPGGYRRARGALPLKSGQERPEETIRRIRDAW